jgi:hypothetical protein
MVPSATALVVSCQVIFGTFFMSILGIRRTRHPEAEALADDGNRAPGASPRKAASAGRPGVQPAGQPNAHPASQSKEPGESVGARSRSGL